MAVDPNTGKGIWDILMSPGGILATVGGGVAALFKLNQYLRKDNVDKASDLAQTDLITMLRQQVDLERARADAERKRSDTLSASLDAQTLQIATLRTQVQALSQQISTMQTKLAQYEPKATP